MFSTTDTDPFPLLRASTVNLPGERSAKISEYIASLAYHLDYATDSARRCGLVTDLDTNPWRPGHPKYYIDVKNGHIFMGDCGLQEMIRCGDTAIRESATVLDIALLLINHAAGTGINQNQLNWTNDKHPASSLKSRLSKIKNGEAAALIAAIQSDWSSIGFHLLKSYRHWVTHRGAPIVVLPSDWDQPIRIPPDALNANHPAIAKQEIEREVRDRILYRVSIQCAKFHPTVQSITTTTLTHENQDSVIPGFFKIEKGARVDLVNFKRIVGNMHSNKESYLKNNPTPTEQDSNTYAGESVVVYSASNYISAVDTVTRFAKNVVTKLWDPPLANLVSAMNP